MKKGFVLTILQIILLLSMLPVSAQEPGSDDFANLPTVSEEMIEVLTHNLENFFPITRKKEFFSMQEEYLFSDVGPDTIVRIGTESGRRRITLFVNSDSVHDCSAIEAITSEYPRDFQLIMDVTVNDAFPRGEGGCFIGFTNSGMPGTTDAESEVLVSVIATGQEILLYIKNGGENAGTWTSLGSSNRIPAKLNFVHLTGHTYVFLNETFLGQFHDGESGPLQMIYGAVVSPNGDTADCSFDNLVFRKVSNQ